MSIILRIVVLLLLVTVFCGFTTMYGTTIDFKVVDGNPFEFYLRVEQAVEEAGFQRSLLKDDTGNYVLERSEDKNSIYSGFSARAPMPGEGVVSISILLYKTDNGIELTMSQILADEFSETAKILFRNLVIILRNKFGKDNVIIEKKMESIMD